MSVSGTRPGSSDASTTTPKVQTENDPNAVVSTTARDRISGGDGRKSVQDLRTKKKVTDARAIWDTPPNNTTQSRSSAPSASPSKAPVAHTSSPAHSSAPAEAPAETSSAPTAPASKKAPAVPIEDNNPIKVTRQPRPKPQVEFPQEEIYPEEPSTSGVQTPEETKPEVKKTDWLKIASIVIGIVGFLFAGFAVLCAANVFPGVMLGGELGVGFTIMGGVELMAAGGSLFYYNQQVKKMQDLPLSS